MIDNFKSSRCWGKYKGEKPLALVWNGCVIPENANIFEVCDVSSTSAIQRMLKSETGNNYDIIRVDYNGEFEADRTELRKVTRLLYDRLKGGCK